MSLKAEIEIILNLHEFKNIALPHRAKYLLTAEIYQGKIKKVQQFISFKELCTSLQHNRN